jgi:hypothetical protein
MPTCVLLTKVSSRGPAQVGLVVKDDKALEAQPRRPSPSATRLADNTLLGAYDSPHMFDAAKVALLASPL